MTAVKDTQIMSIIEFATDRFNFPKSTFVSFVRDQFLSRSQIEKMEFIEVIGLKKSDNKYILIDFDKAVGKLWKSFGDKRIQRSANFKFAKIESKKRAAEYAVSEMLEFALKENKKMIEILV